MVYKEAMNVLLVTAYCTVSDIAGGCQNCPISKMCLEETIDMRDDYLTPDRIIEAMNKVKQVNDEMM